MLLLLLQEHVAVGKGGFGVMDGAWSNDDQESVVGVGTVDDSCYLFTTIDDSTLGLGCLGNLMLEEIGWREWVVATNCRNMVSTWLGSETQVRVQDILRQSSLSALLPTFLFSMKKVCSSW